MLTTPTPLPRAKGGKGSPGLISKVGERMRPWDAPPPRPAVAEKRPRPHPELPLPLPQALVALRRVLLAQFSAFPCNGADLYEELKTSTAILSTGIQRFVCVLGEEGERLEDRTASTVAAYA